MTITVQLVTKWSWQKVNTVKGKIVGLRKFV